MVVNKKIILVKKTKRGTANVTNYWGFNQYGKGRILAKHEVH